VEAWSLKTILGALGADNAPIGGGDFGGDRGAPARVLAAGGLLNPTPQVCFVC
jgi:hypothetical protein